MRQVFFKAYIWKHTLRLLFFEIGEKNVKAFTIEEKLFMINLCYIHFFLTNCNTNKCCRGEGERVYISSFYHTVMHIVWKTFLFFVLLFTYGLSLPQRYWIICSRKKNFPKRSHLLSLNVKIAYALKRTVWYLEKNVVKFAVLKAKRTEW